MLVHQVGSDLPNVPAPIVMSTHFESMRFIAPAVSRISPLDRAQ
jgi:hypothetical protein